MFGCKHKYGKVDGNYQYCEKCGKAITAPLTKHQHQWKEINRLDISGLVNNNVFAVKYILQCSGCGVLDIKEINSV